MANPYQTALTKQLTGSRSRVNAPGYQAPVDPWTAIDQPDEISHMPITPTGPLPTLGTGPAQSGGGSLADILGKYQYGAKGLADAEQELAGAGYQLQKGSRGVRGRLKAANGDIIDVIDQNEGNDWWNNQTGQNWSINNRGQEGLDAGGWSFGGPSNDMDLAAMQMPAPLQMQTPQTGDWRDVAVSADAGQRSPFLEALLAQLGGQL